MRRKATCHVTSLGCREFGSAAVAEHECGRKQERARPWKASADSGREERVRAKNSGKGEFPFRIEFRLNEPFAF